MYRQHFGSDILASGRQSDSSDAFAVRAVILPAPAPDWAVLIGIALLVRMRYDWFVDLGSYGFLHVIRYRFWSSWMYSKAQKVVSAGPAVISPG